MGIEIARGVGSPTDGRPMMIQVGTHHAREWPANESTLEWGYELIKNFSRAQLQPAVRRKARPVNARSFVIPVMNMDGFDATIESEGRNPDGSYEDPVDSGGEPGATRAAIRARGRARTSARPARSQDPGAPGPPVHRPHELPVPRPDDDQRPADRGVDPNRNYGVEWGGPGTSDRGRGPHLPRPEAWSEPETQAMRESCATCSRRS